MHHFGTVFLWALAACILFDGSFAKSPRFGYTILLDDISPNQTELRSLLSDVVQAQDQGNTRDADIATKVLAKLDSVADQQAKLQGQLQGVEAKMERNLLGLQNRLESRLEGVLFKIESQLQAVSQNIDAAAKVETEVHPVLNKTEAPQQAPKVGVPASDTNTTTSSGFELIGDRYFRIVNEELDWASAEKRCRELGGYLASFRNEEELHAIMTKDVVFGLCFWLGINDQENEGHFVSVASHKPAPFLKWQKGYPKDKNHVRNCVYLFNGAIGDAFCITSLPFICQADNET